MNAAPVRVSRISRETSGALTRISAAVDGETVWFEAENAPLRTSAEAFACAFLLPAMSRRRDLVVEGALGPRWLSNVRRLMPIARAWWRYPVIGITAAGPPDPARPAQPAPPRTRTALFFSGGVDSFFSFVRHPVDDLIYVWGFDIPLRDRQRMEAFGMSLAAIGEASGARPVLVRTNLRETSFYGAIPWDNAHGGALAAVAHLLPELRECTISASYPYAFFAPWGTSWKIDPLWASDAFTIVHRGAEHWRSDKLRMIAGHPLVRAHLRVCWENRSAALNCGRCEKCLRTILVLMQCGALGRFSCFERRDVAADLDRLPHVGSDLIRVYKGFPGDGLPVEVSRSVAALIRRSRLQWLASRPLIRHVLKRLKRGFPGRTDRKPAPEMPPRADAGMTGFWDSRTLRSRIRNVASRARHAAGSPTGIELDIYAQEFAPVEDASLAVILGMTPELRRLAARRFRTLITIDRNPDAIRLYRDWLDREHRGKETVVTDDWLNLGRHLPGGASLIAGDGAFGNLPDVPSHLGLLRAIHARLPPGGRFVTRHAMIPRGFDPPRYDTRRLIDAFRAGRLDEAEFAFGVRLLGHYACCYDPRTFLLDNARLFAECAASFERGDITPREHDLIRRYYFGGKNCILPQELWEGLLMECGFDFRIPEYGGKAWHRYYRIYSCTPHRGRARVSPPRGGAPRPVRPAGPATSSRPETASSR